jgi:hypothetical protein
MRRLTDSELGSISLALGITLLIDLIISIIANPAISAQVARLLMCPFGLIIVLMMERGLDAIFSDSEQNHD